MREIKFRAWDKEAKEMFYSDDGRGFQFELSPMAGNGITDLKGNALLDRDFTDWMQFTGLTDKNGKEIYEKDFVKYLFLGLGEPHYLVGQIVFSNFGFCIKLPQIAGMEQVETIAKHINDIEVVGNIYQNPDLLK
jgi:uncharacterized phage protein (TIGR01671 family)